ncbi:gCN5-related N-acetyltransferase [Firmicutes bacterium CAG:884]|nr:gCN5-related N-acetyltransferase [Firmicutes bacterium CAG:884]
MEIIKLEESNNLFFDKICDWYYNWLGIKNNESIEEIKCTFEHSLCKNKLPQTFVALIDGEPAGMYQLSMSDDLNSRPDLYPWLINVYVDEKFRGRNVARELMNTVKENAKKLGLTELYLYTKHIGLYEKFGWKFIEEVKTFKDDSPVERLYKLEI